MFSDNNKISAGEATYGGLQIWGNNMVKLTFNLLIIIVLSESKHFCTYLFLGWLLYCYMKIFIDHYCKDNFDYIVSAKCSCDCFIFD